MFQTTVRFFYSLRVARSLRILVLDAPFRQKDRTLRAIHRQIIRQRTTYARAMHWPIEPGVLDNDYYDRDPQTHYIAAVMPAKRVRVEASMRMTNITGLESSLSFFMWDHALCRVQFEKQLSTAKADLTFLKKVGKEGNLWDLTRLISRTALKKRRNWNDRLGTHVALMMLFGGGMALTGKQACWVFTCDERLKRFLDRRHIEYTLLAHGRISAVDEGESFLCYSEIQPAIDKLYKRSALFFKIVSWGHYKVIAQESEKI